MTDKQNDKKTCNHHHAPTQEQDDGDPDQDDGTLYSGKACGQDGRVCAWYAIGDEGSCCGGNQEPTRMGVSSISKFHLRRSTLHENG